MPLTSESQLAVGSGEVEIHYAALSYVSPEKVRFKYMLEGVDKDWVDAGVRRFAYYANLPAGKYRFRVVAGYPEGIWNKSGAWFGFYLKPRFYQTTLFVCLVVATVLLIIVLLTGRMIELKARYSAVLGERNRIAREIHDTLAQNLAGIALQLEMSVCTQPIFPQVLISVLIKHATWCVTVCLKRAAQFLIFGRTNSTARVGR